MTSTAKGAWRLVDGTPPCWASDAFLTPTAFETPRTSPPASRAALWIALLFGTVLGAVVIIFRQRQSSRGREKELRSQLETTKARVAGILDADAEEARVRAEVQKLADESDALSKTYVEKRAIYDALLSEIAVYDDRLSFAEMGVYDPHFDFTDSEAYKDAIRKCRDRQKVLIASKQAVVCRTAWTVDGSKTKGETMANRSIRLTLRAFNNECEVAVANVRWNNVSTMAARITKAQEQIDKLNQSNNTVITNDYAKLRLEELLLTHEYREKLKAEKEERAEAARLAREEQRLIRDLEEAQEREAHYEQLVAKARAEAATSVGVNLDAQLSRIQVLEAELAEAHSKAERAQAMAEQTRSGYVYIISNIGSFGEGVIKIGLTRRLDPLDRIRELGDASVPFVFDMHAIIYSEDAPNLERTLHAEFEARRINAQNYRKEFFRASLDEVEAAIQRLAPSAPFFKDIEAQEYRETLARRQGDLERQSAARHADFPATI
ncbi:MAG: DUF4041 domain-containing protein [Phenylobacterium sp.]|uniref:DUF4041 domain-containing protein n=1 Tax=Phenylobacterium sp. TaxID=1871053 RepID=UPI00120E82D1|nr:DUF4041 domain-containing protein [Phenylobacterium sp.]TAJ69002.1 MAG: DUF4041 domain-containing protein [Phenylobacterium sp.]